MRGAGPCAWGVEAIEALRGFDVCSVEREGGEYQQIVLSRVQVIACHQTETWRLPSRRSHGEVSVIFSKGAQKPRSRIRRASLRCRGSQRPSRSTDELYPSTDLWPRQQGFFRRSHRATSPDTGSSRRSSPSAGSRPRSSWRGSMIDMSASLPALERPSAEKGPSASAGLCNTGDEFRTGHPSFEHAARVDDRQQRRSPGSPMGILVQSPSHRAFCA